MQIFFLFIININCILSATPFKSKALLTLRNVQYKKVFLNVLFWKCKGF